MIKTEFYMERKDGVKLYRTFSDSGVMIKKKRKNEYYAEAVDVEGAGFEYIETKTPIDDNGGE